MKIIEKIYETEKVRLYLKKRNLDTQYIKSCRFLLAGFFGKTDFKLRQPKSQAIYSFRINKQFRAYGYFESSNFIVYHIDNHQ